MQQHLQLLSPLEIRQVQDKVGLTYLYQIIDGSCTSVVFHPANLILFLAPAASVGEITIPSFTNVTSARMNVSGEIYS